MNTENVGGGIAAPPPPEEFLVIGVAPIMFMGGPAVGGIPGMLPEGGRPIPAGVLRLGTRRPAGAMRAASGSEGSAAGVAGVAAGAGVDIDIVGGGGGARALASSAGSS